MIRVDFWRVGESVIVSIVLIQNPIKNQTRGSPRPAVVRQSYERYFRYQRDKVNEEDPMDRNVWRSLVKVGKRPAFAFFAKKNNYKKIK